MKPILRIFTWGWVGLFWLGTSWAGTETLSLPITLDPPLLRAFLIQQAYTEPGNRAVLGDKKDDCNRVELWDPQIKIGEELTVLSSRIRIRAGLAVGTRCLQPVDWEGTFEGRLKPVLDPAGLAAEVQGEGFPIIPAVTRMSFPWPGSPGIRPKGLSMPIWRKFSLTWLPPWPRSGNWSRPWSAPERREETSAWLETLRLGTLRSSTEAIRS